jgi:hypothetical protein
MATSVGTAVPGNVNLSRQKPYAVSAYSRRVKSLANNAQAFGPDSYVNITLDTSTPGSFLDPLQSYLKWDLTILNSNPFCDFVSFGQAGSASLIEEFRIYIQGTPIEEILQYNVFYELAMNQNGQCQQPYELFTSNKNVQPVNQIFHQNAIKPPMIDRLGKPMYGTTKKVNGASRACSWVSSDNSSSFFNSRMIASQSTLSTKVCFSGCRPFFTTTIQSTPNLVADAQGLLFGLGRTLPADLGSQGPANVTLPVGSTLNNMTYPSYFQSAAGTIVNTLAPVSMVSGNMGAMSSGSSGLELLNTSVGVSGGATVSAITNYLVAADGGILPYGGSTVEVPSCVGGSISSVDPDYDPTNPLNWSTLLPETAIRPDIKTLGPQNLQDYFMFLSNCKYIPVGMPGVDKTNSATYDTSYTIPQGYITSSNFRNLQAYDSSNDTRGFTYTCCIPLISGVLGSFADKCWPTMLVAPGSMYIQIRTASPQKAFQLSMDPCRRVLGTIRDYLPFGGTIGGLFGQIGSSNVVVGAGLSSVPPAGNLTLASNFYNTAPGAGGQVSQVGNFPISGLNGCLPSETSSDYRAVRTFSVENNGAISQTMDPRSIHSKFNGYCCLGSSLVSASARLNKNVFDNYESRGFGLLFKPYSVAALEGKWTIGRSYVQQMQQSIFNSGSNTVFKSRQISEEGGDILGNTTGYGTNLLPPATLATGAYTTTAALPAGTLYPNTATSGDSVIASANIPSVAARQALSAVVSATGVAASTSGADSIYTAVAGYSPDADVTVEFTPAGIPLPQYYLHATPWLKKTFAYKIGFAEGGTTLNYQLVGMQQDGVASEATACYGTYLTASVPQCRRVLTHLSSGSNGGITYSLSNIEFVSQQIILPDSVSASILEDAAQGDISINSNSLHNFQTPIAQSDSQNLIIPAKIASANTMYCLFQPQTFVSGTEAFCYNSLRGICPFGSVAVPTGSGIIQNGLTAPYTSTGLGYNDGELIIRNIPCSSGQLQVQLKIGNELVPQQPLTTMNEIMTENVKAQHKLFDTLSNVNTTFALTTKRTVALGIDDFSSSLCYDVVAPDTFCTTFVSAELTDDQTAIDNPCMSWVYACEANYLGGSNQKTKSSYVISRKPNQAEIFQPPSSTFVLAFDLDTWSRYSDVTRSGKFLGNNTITLTMQNAVALGYAPNQVRSGGYVLQTFIVHDIRFSFQAGGSVVSYY